MKTKCNALSELLFKLKGGGGEAETHQTTAEFIDAISKVVDQSYYTEEFYHDIFSATAEYSGEPPEAILGDGVLLVTGNTYVIVFDGETYSYTYTGGEVQIGNKSLNNTGDDTGEPFYYDVMRGICYCAESGQHTLKIKGFDEIIHTIPEKYIPGTPIALIYDESSAEAYDVIYDAQKNKKMLAIWHNGAVLPCVYHSVDTTRGVAKVYAIFLIQTSVKVLCREARKDSESSTSDIIYLTGITLTEE